MEQKSLDKKPSEKNEVPSNSKLNPEPVIEAAPSPQPASVKSASVNGVNKQTIGGGMVPPQNGPLPVAPQQLPLLPQQQMPMPTYSYPFSPFPSPLYPNGVIYPNVPSTPSAGNTNGTPVTGLRRGIRKFYDRLIRLFSRWMRNLGSIYTKFMHISWAHIMNCIFGL